MPSMVVTSKSGADWPTRLPVRGDGGAGVFVGGTGVGVSVSGKAVGGTGVERHRGWGIRRWRCRCGGRMSQPCRYSRWRGLKRAAEVADVLQGAGIRSRRGRVGR